MKSPVRLLAPGLFSYARDDDALYFIDINKVDAGIDIGHLQLPREFAAGPSTPSSTAGVALRVSRASSVAESVLSLASIAIASSGSEPYPRLEAARSG
jgi:hypothetical protein